MKAIIPKGIFMIKSQCHVVTERIHPARLGPAAVAIEINMAFRANPLPRICRG